MVEGGSEVERMRDKERETLTNKRLKKTRDGVE